jgi:peptide deformylase
MVKIVQKENPVLHQPAQEVPAELFGTPKLEKILKEMSQALAKEEDGVALAGPQIAVPYRIFIISGKVLTKGDLPQNSADLVFINPKITKLSKTTSYADEGCLSVRWLFGQVKRADKATVEAYDFSGKKFTRSGSGLIAQIFQHETDHLEGVLFTEKAKNLQEYLPTDGN